MSTQDDSTAGSTSGLQVPTETARQFEEIITLIRQSQSMNDEERQYWVDILPVMTPDQVRQLRDILINERDQLAAIDAKYAQQLNQNRPSESVLRMEQDRRQQRSARSAHEQEEREKAEQKAAEILDTIDDRVSGGSQEQQSDE